MENRSKYIYIYIPSKGWKYYINMNSSNDSLLLLNLLANDCYRMGHFYYSCKAFDVLERLEPDPEHWEGKRGAAVGKDIYIYIYKYIYKYIYIYIF